MNGWDALKAIRKGDLNRDTPVIVATVVADRKAALGYRIHDFLVKPVKEEELLAALEKIRETRDGNRKIVVVDDDKSSLKLAESLLREAGYTPICSSSGKAGLRAAEKEKPAAVILDLLMPELDGFQFLERFRRMPAGQRTPVIVWTVKDLSPADRRQLKTLAQAVVVKGDGAPDQLLNELEVHLGRGRAERRQGPRETATQR